MIGSDGRAALLEDILRPRFLIAAADPTVLNWLDAEAARRWGAIGGECVLLTDAPPPAGTAIPVEVTVARDAAGELGAWLKAHGAGAVVVRPDRYVYGVAKDARGLQRLIADVGRRLL